MNRERMDNNKRLFPASASPGRSFVELALGSWGKSLVT